MLSHVVPFYPSLPLSDRGFSEGNRVLLAAPFPPSLTFLPLRRGVRGVDVSRRFVTLSTDVCVCRPSNTTSFTSESADVDFLFFLRLRFGEAGLRTPSDTLSEAARRKFWFSNNPFPCLLCDISYIAPSDIENGDMSSPFVSSYSSVILVLHRLLDLLSWRVALRFAVKRFRRARAGDEELNNVCPDPLRSHNVLLP